MSKVAPVPGIPKNRVLASKEATLFKSVLQLYESRQWKRALKTADQILKKYPEHGETTSMKGLVLTNMGKKEEGTDLVKKGLRFDLTSHICWHVLGLIHKSDRNYEEALKCYNQALRFDKDNINILRDAAHMQTQLRQFDALIESRQILLKYRANLRQGWGALALAYHMNGQPDAGIEVLELYEKTVKNVPRGDPEHSEVLLYHVTLLRAAERWQDALEFLDKHEKDRTITDRLAISLNRAAILAKLDRIDDAREVWYSLISKNPECYEHYDGYLSTLGSSIHAREGAPLSKAISSLRELAEKHPKALAPKRLLLNLVSGDEFRTLVEPYIRRGITGGIPSIFTDLKTLYDVPEKREIVESIATAILEEQDSRSASNPETREPPTTLVWALYFLAQHHAYSHPSSPAASSQSLATSLSLLDRALSHTPTLPELHMLRARALKRSGDPLGAAAGMTVGWRLDLQDRFLNTKCAKYLLRAGYVEEAEKMLGLFTRKSAPSPGADLEDMQSIFYFSEEGDAYQRLGKLNMALKRYHGIAKLFDDHEDDQYDFHSYALRKYNFNAYISFLGWEDHLRAHPAYAHAALAAARIYVRLHNDPKLAKPDANMSNAEKKAAKKAKKAEQKQAEESKKAPPPPANDDDSITPKDDDPDGSKLLATSTPLEVAAKLLIPLYTHQPKLVDLWVVSYDVSVRRGKFLQALRALKTIQALEPGNPELHVRIADLKTRVTAQPSLLSAEIAPIVTSGLDELAPGQPSLEQLNTTSLQQGPTTAEKLLAAARVAHIINQPAQVEEYVFQMLNDEAGASVKLASTALSFLRSTPSTRADEFRAACDAKYTNSTIFKTDDELAALRKKYVFGIGEDHTDDAKPEEEA